jgi:hypothetical protein
LAVTGRALLKGRGIVCISSVDWEFNWQGHRQIMSALAERGSYVFLVENTGVRAPAAPRDLPRLVAHVRNRWRDAGTPRIDRTITLVADALSARA